MNASDLNAILPLIVLVVWACALLLIDLFFGDRYKPLTPILAAAGIAVTLGLTLAQIGQNRLAFGGMAALDGYAVFLNALFLGSGLAAVALSYDYLTRMGINRGEYYVLLLFSLSGMMLMSLAADLIVVFLALELLSIPLYILAGFARPRLDSEEASLKYFLLGAFAAGFMVYGVALVYGATGTTNLREIAAALAGGGVNITLLALGAALMLVGLGFKVGAAPFHMWSPDVYQGAPSAVTAFMAVGAKAGGFAALFRVFVTVFGAPITVSEKLIPVLWGLAAATMILGNVAAIAQANIKRLLAYSSIAQAGYILIALVSYANPAVSGDAVAAALFYLLAFAVTSFGVWAVVMTLEKTETGTDGLNKGLSVADYAGLARKHPWLAAAMTVFMLSLTGLPPTLGFAGKLFVFRTAIESGYIGLAVIGVLTSLVSAYYYLRIVVLMYMHPGEPEVHRERWLRLFAGAAAVGTVVLMFFAAPLFDWAARSALLLF